MSKASRHEFDNHRSGYDPRVATVAPGYSIPNPEVFRNDKEYRLAGYGPPATSYPDDLLGGVRSTMRSYDRGVHVGERINPASYLWPIEFGPDTSLKAEAKGEKWAPAGTGVNELLPGPNSIPGEGVVPIDPQRQGILRHLLPAWR